MEKNNILVSVLVPAYNVEEYLPQCLDSIVGQTYPHLQVVVVDDGSKDSTFSIAKDYAARYPFIEVYYQENAGVAAARNNLLSHVKGDYVLFVDSDDWIELGMVECLINIAIDENVDIVTCDGIPKGGRTIQQRPKTEIWSKEVVVREFLRHVNFAGSLWNKLIKTELIQSSRFDTRISYGEDALFCWEILQRVNQIKVTDAPLYNHRINENSLSISAWTPQKKGSGSIVWKTISDEAKQWWPQYADIAFTRYAIEDMWGLYYASLANYPFDEHIKERQINIRKNLKLIRKSGLVSKNKIVTAYALAYCYKFGKLLRYV